MIKIAPSILAADFSKLEKEVKTVKEADYLHLDVMDGSFVPAISFGAGLIASLRPHSSLIFDTHLMVANPEKYIEDFVKAGSDMITVHAESVVHLHRTIQLIKEQQLRAGVSLNPATPLQVLEYVLDDLDLILIMSVNPGAGGQKFIPVVYQKIKKLAALIKEKNLDILISVDGGINTGNVKKVVQAGADIVVAGSAIFKSENPAQVIKNIRKIASGSRKEHH